MSQKDEELMLLYQMGEFTAFEILYNRHSGRVYEYLRKKSGVEQTAKDLMQDVFEKLHKSRSKYNPQYPFLPWLFTIARNTLLDFYKRNETRVSNAASESLDLVSAPKEEDRLPEGQDILPTLQTLPSPQRRAIELRYLQEWSFEKIAADLDTSEINARKLISRGLKRMRDLFSKENKS